MYNVLCIRLFLFRRGSRVLLRRVRRGYGRLHPRRLLRKWFLGALAVD